MTVQNELAPVKAATALAPMSIKETVLAQFKEAETDLAAMAERYRAVVYDVTTPKGMKEAKEARADLRDNGRLLVTRAATRIKADVNSLKKVMDDEVDRLVAIVKPIEEAVGAQIKAEEDRKAAEKAERDRIEAERVAKHRANIDKLKSYAARAEGQPVEALEKAIETLSALTFGEEWEEFAVEASGARDNTVEAMRKMVDGIKQRAENERLAAELAQAKAALAAREQEETAARQQAEAKAKAEADATAKAEADAAQSKAQAEASEAARLKAEADAEAQRLESERLARELEEANAAAAEAAQQAQQAQAAEQAQAPAPAAAPVAAPAVCERLASDMQTLTTESHTRMAAPAPTNDQRLNLHDLSEDEFKLLVDGGGTLSIGQINTRLALLSIDAAKLADLGVTTRKYRGAVHMEAADFPVLSNKLIAHLQALRDQYAA